jgi:hypothetical protein
LVCIVLKALATLGRALMGTLLLGELKDDAESIQVKSFFHIHVLKGSKVFTYLRRSSLHVYILNLSVWYLNFCFILISVELLYDHALWRFSTCLHHYYDLCFMFVYLRANINQKLFFLCKCFLFSSSGTRFPSLWCTWFLIDALAHYSLTYHEYLLDWSRLSYSTFSLHLIVIGNRIRKSYDCYVNHLCLIACGGFWAAHLHLMSVLMRVPFSVRLWIIE